MSVAYEIRVLAHPRRHAPGTLLQGNLLNGTIFTSNIVAIFIETKFTNYKCLLMKSGRWHTLDAMR
jgi:hypothetical protein